MANNRRKSAALALVVLGVAGLSLASASVLNLTAGTLQAGTQDLTDCQPVATPVVVGFGAPTFAAGVAGKYTVNSVNLTALNAACSGKNYSVTLLDAAGDAIGTTTTVNAVMVTAGAASIALPTAVAAQAIEGVAVVISN